MVDKYSLGYLLGSIYFVVDNLTVTLPQKTVQN